MFYSFPQTELPKLDAVIDRFVTIHSDSTRERNVIRRAKDVAAEKMREHGRLDAETGGDAASILTKGMKSLTLQEGAGEDDEYIEEYGCTRGEARLMATQVEDLIRLYPEAWNLFLAIDTSGDMEVDRKELVTACRATGRGATTSTVTFVDYFTSLVQSTRGLSTPSAPGDLTAWPRNDQ